MVTQKKKATASAASGLRRFYIVLGLVAVVGALALAYALLRGGAGGAAIEPVELAGVDDPRALYARARGVVIGPETAPVKLVVFSDFMCPYCGQFASQIKPRLQEAFVDGGRLQIVYYDFPLGGTHRHSFLAARAARCAGDQGKFWEYHDLLFGRQSEWSPEASPPVDDFIEYAGVVGVERGAFERCLKSDRYADTVTANRLLGEQLGVNATPWVIVNNRYVRNALDYGDLKQVIEQELGA